MAWNQSDEIVVANTGAVSVAPVGTALPTNPTAALNAAFIGLGYINEDGVSLSITPQITEFMAWQSRQAIRRELTAQEVQAQFNLQQWNETTVPLAFGGGAVTNPSGSIYKYTLPLDGDALDERALVIDGIDGSRHFRLVLPRGNVTDAVSTTFRRSQEALLPITFKALQPSDGEAPGYFLFDDAEAFATGS
jgi:stage V sporulation protein SpoVS